VPILINTHKFFQMIELHQAALLSLTMNKNAPSRTVATEISSMQSRLQTLDSMLRLWTEVQDMWLCLSDIFGTQPKASSDQYSSMKDLSEAGDIKYAEVRCFE
jgi:hypothetical protein